jgi:hypothetical protein
MSDLIAAPGIGRHIGARQQNLLGGRATMAGNNAHRLAALNQALAELGHDIILDPMSATAFGTHANLVTREGPDTRLLDDPLNLNLLAGDTTRLSFVTRDGLQHAEFEVDGFLDSVIVFRGDDEAVEREEDYAEEGVNRAYQRKSLELKRRNAACKGWLYDYSETGPLPREAQELRREHPEWIMPKSDDPSYRQDYSMGSASVLLARETYRHIHGGRRLKTDTQRVKKLTNALRRFVGHINPLILHRPGRELEAQLHDRAHVAAHLLHQGGHYKHWEHWITHNEISTRAFMNLNVEQQVWLIFELLSGPDYAKLVALSILQDPLFVNAQFNIAMRGVTGDTPYNCFMRHYIEFMQKHVNDASQPSPVIETRKMLFIEQLTLMTEMSAGRETDPATGDPLEGRAGQIADFLNNHTRKSALILGALIGTLLPDRATHHRDEILPYLGEDDGEADEAEDVELSADAKQLNKLLELERYFKKLLGGSSANRDAEDLLTRRASVNVGDIGERVFIRKNLFHVRWLIAYYKARIHVGELFLSLGQNPRKQELIDDLIGAHPEFVMLALPLNNDHLDMGMLKHMLHRIDLSVMNDTLRNYIWHALAKIIENDSAFVIQFMLSNYSNLLTPRQVTGSLNSILQPPAVTAENRNTLIRYALTATRDARLPGWGHEQKKACVHALYVELAFSQGNSVFDFYQRLLNVEPQLLPLAINHSLDTMDWLIEYLHELKPDADQVAVQNMLSYSGDINIIDDLLAYYAVGVPDNVDKEISKSIISAWLKADRLRGHVPNQKFHAHEYIIGKLGEEFADHHFGLAASLIKINLTSDVPRWALINRALNALKASCVGLSEDAEDHMVDDQFSNARILFLLCQKGLITEQEKRQLAEGLINQYAGHRDDAAYEDYANYIWIHVNDAYPIPAAAVDGVDPALLTSEDRERITHCAQKIMGLLGSEARVSTQMPLADKVRDAIEDRHKIIDPNTSDRSLGFLMSAMLEYCVEQPDAGSQYTTLAFNCLMRRYHQFATEHFRESYWMGDEGEERPPQPWLRQLFFSYLRFFYREQGDALVIDADGDMVAANRNFSESIIQRFQTGAVAADGYDAYWQRFRESCVTLHYNWKVWKNGRDDSQAFSHLLTLAQCGFRAGNELLQGEQRNQVIQDAWHLLHAYLDYNVREIPSDNRRESFPDPSQWTAEQRLAVLNELYAYTPNPPEHDIGVGNLPEGCSTRTSLVAQLVHVFLNPGRLPENAFHNFATTLLRQIIINMRSVGYHIADDFMLINQLLNSLPDQLKKYPVGEVNDDTPVNERVNLRVKQRLVLAYAYWKWNNCSSRSWVSFFACGFSRTQDQNIAACHVQAMMQVLGINTSVGADAQARANARNVAVNVYPDEFLARLGIRGTFAAWFRARLNQDVSPPPQLSQLGGIQGDYEDQGEEAPLLGRDGLRLAEEGRISQQEQGAEDGSWWACFK